MSRVFDTAAVGGYDCTGASLPRARSQATAFDVQELGSFQAIDYTYDGREILIGRHLLASSPQYILPAGTPYYTCDTYGDSTNKGVTVGESAYGEVVRYRRDRFNAVPARTVGTLPELAGDGIQLITSPYAVVMWTYEGTSPIGNYELAPYEPRFGTYVWTGSDDLGMIIGGRGTSESAVPACGIGWYPNDPATDGITECNNDGLGIRNAYQLYTRAATDEAWVLASSKWCSLPAYDNYLPTLNSVTGTAWSKQGRFNVANRTTFDTWAADEDPMDPGTSVTTVTLPSGTITSWIHDGTYTAVLSSNNNVYVYDGTTLASTLSTGSGTVAFWYLKDGWICVGRGATDTHFYKESGGAFSLHSTHSDPVIDYMELLDDGIGVDDGAYIWEYDPGADAWSYQGAFFAGSDLQFNGWGWTRTLNKDVVFVKDSRLAFARIK